MGNEADNKVISELIEILEERRILFQSISDSLKQLIIEAKAAFD